MNILSIGNSFSQDAQRYLHRIAAADKENLTTFNLYIGGCPLSKHYRNMLTGREDYTLEMNGVSTDFYVSLGQALLNRDWDVVTIQQASLKSTCYDNYSPYIKELAAYIRKCCPGAKLAIHQTWAYEQDSSMLNDMLGYKEQTDMFADLKEAYDKAAKDVNADIFIPSGGLMQALLKNGIKKIHRDTFHASFGLGRYAIGLLWYKVLLGADIENNSFCDFDEEVTKEEIAIAKKSVNDVLNEYDICK